MLHALAQSILAAERMLGAEQLRAFLGRYFREAAGGLAAAGRERRIPAEREPLFVPDLILVPSSTLAIDRVTADLRLGLRPGRRDGRGVGIGFVAAPTRPRSSDRRPSCRISLSYRAAAAPTMVATMQMRLASPVGAHEPFATERGKRNGQKT